MGDENVVPDHQLDELLIMFEKHSDLIKEDYRKNPIQEGEEYFNLPNALLCLGRHIKRMTDGK